MAQHNELGSKGEELALAHLRTKGFLIKECNWRYGKEEVDIIATKDDRLVIIEVKTRNSSFFGSHAQFVSKAKQRHLIRAAQGFTDQKGIDLEVRFDVIGIVLNQQQVQIDHIENAFQPQW